MNIYDIQENYLCLTNNHNDIYMVSHEVVFALNEWLHNSREAADKPKTRKVFRKIFPECEKLPTLHFTKVGKVFANDILVF